jgi:hypothetical protein
MVSWKIKLFYFNKYLTITPNGKVMNIIHKERIYPFNSDFWSEDDCREYFESHGYKFFFIEFH